MISSSSFVARRCLATAVNNVVVLGGGLMGAGIAQVAAQTGHNVTLVDVNQEVLDKSRARIEESVARVAKRKYGKEDPAEATRFVESTLARLNTNVSATDACTGDKADVVVEAVIEKLDLKRKILRELEQVSSRETIFATNTSTLLLSDISRDMARKDKFVGLHFFNPVPVMKLLEVVRTPHTSQETMESALAFGMALGKTTVVCKDTEGFVVNKLLGALLSEALAMVERGDATFRDVDTAMKLGAGHPMGPFELLDYVGLDLHMAIREEKRKGSTEKIIADLVSQGKFGRKTGEGFYKY